MGSVAGADYRKQSALWEDETDLRHTSTIGGCHYAGESSKTSRGHMRSCQGQ